MDSSVLDNRKYSDDPNRWLDDDILRRLIEMNPMGAQAQKSDKILIPTEIQGRVSFSRLESILGEFRKIRARQGAHGTVDVLALRLSASGRPDLYEYIRRVGEFSVGNAYHVVRLLDFGAESLVFLGETNTGDPIAIKIPLVDFTNLAHLDVDQLLRRRRRLAHEANMLRALSDTVFPAFIGEQLALNPLFPPRMPSFLRDSEQFLIIEYVKGFRVDAVARSLMQQERHCCALRLAAEFATTFFNLSEIIRARIGSEAAYTDIKPENALLQDSGVRIVDASSIVTSIGAGPHSISVSKTYLDPIDHQRWTVGDLLPNSAFMVRSVVRATHALVANTPLFVAKAAPAWPPNALEDFGPTMDSLAADPNIDLRHAIETSSALLKRLTCEHGTGPISISNE